MRFGITLPQFGPVVAPGLIADFARSAEQLGYESLWAIPLSTLDLRPVQPGGPPVLLGGYGSRALKRVGRRASGWLPSIAPGRGLTVAMLDQPWPTIVRAAVRGGRPGRDGRLRRPADGRLPRGLTRAS